MMNNQSLEQQLYDIYTLAYVPWWRTTPFYVCCALFASVLGVATIYLLIRWYKARFCKRTPWDSALQELNALRSRSLSPDQSRLFYYTLTALIKTYLHERYGYAVADKTDEECSVYLATTDFPPELLTDMQTILRAGIMSKFAAAQDTQAQMREHAQMAIDLIARTIPQKRTR